MTVAPGNAFTKPLGLSMPPEDAGGGGGMGAPTVMLTMFEVEENVTTPWWPVVVAVLVMTVPAGGAADAANAQAVSAQATSPRAMTSAALPPPTLSPLVFTFSFRFLVCLVDGPSPRRPSEKGRRPCERLRFTSRIDHHAEVHDRRLRRRERTQVENHGV